MEVIWKALLDLPVGVVFYEEELPSMPLFQKMGNAINREDIRVRCIATSDEMRLGLPEMEEIERNSKRWHICDATELARIILYLSEATIALAERKELGQ
jgi:hypothetical protein